MGQLARKYSYDEAILRLNRSIFWRLKNPSPGRSSLVVLLHSDLRRAIDRAENGASPLTPEELGAVGCHVGPLGLIEHGRPSGFVVWKSKKKEKEKKRKGKGKG